MSARNRHAQELHEQTTTHARVARVTQAHRVSNRWLYDFGVVIWFFVVVCLFHGYTILLRGYTVFQRGYIILRGYTTFAWLYASLPWLFSSFACLYGFPWLYDLLSKNIY